MDFSIVRRRWAIAEGYFPGWSHGPEPEMLSHEAFCILNATVEDATLNGLTGVLATDGYLLEPRDLTTDPMVSVPASEYYIPGSGYLQIYEFNTAQDAASEVGEIELSARSVVPSSVYQHGRLVVAYYGRDGMLRADLDQALGQSRL